MMRKQRKNVAAGQEALAIARRLARSVEVKDFQSTQSSTNLLAATGLLAVAAPVRGDNATDRSGNYIRCRALTLRAKLYSLVPSCTTFRVVVVKTGQATAAWTGGSAPLFLSGDTVAQRDRRYIGSNTILWDYTVTLNASFLNGDLGNTFEHRINLNDMEMHFADGGAAEKNALYMLINADIADSASPTSRPAIGDCGYLIYTDFEFTDA